YASNSPVVTSTRTGTRDFSFQDKEFLYVDSYFGNKDFIGEEVVYKGDTIIWGMNYYGRMLTGIVPAGFSDFLKKALREVSSENPFRGPDILQDGLFEYLCSWEGDLANFSGLETISHQGRIIYRLVFHGGQIT
ncbi:MAG: DUF5680 domain-containing protein, partial [Halanaerobium sp.]|nr:DUF5680 domain-containing protein [Halanaerobium sp.]